jgi:hypothetical protein
MNRTEEHGLYYKIEGDNRWHFDSAQANILLASKPDRAHDICPVCGAVGCDGCRCMEDHRRCGKCHTGWQWVLDNATATISQVIEKK